MHASSCKACTASLAAAHDIDTSVWCVDARARAAGHFHLSHNYADSIAVAGHCAFVQTGVIGDCNRDGFRHSRVLKGAELARGTWHGMHVPCE